MKNMQEIDDVYEINDVISAALKRKWEILSGIWEKYYKSRCGKDYLTFQEFIQEIVFWNNASFDCTKEARFKDACCSLNDANIPELLHVCERFGFVQFGTKVPKMICEACACKGCPYLKEHLGYDCQTCRKEMHFSGYEGYCDE